VPFLVFLLTFALYLRTLAPSVVALFDDSLEFQLVGYKLAIAHPTGYPLYTLLLHLTSWLPIGDVAYRANLLSALCASLAVMFVYLTTVRRTDSIVAACVAAFALAISPVFWSQAVMTEVYALHALLVAMILWVSSVMCQVSSERAAWQVASSRWTRRMASSGWTLMAFLLGLGLAHHRTILLLVPALCVYVLLEWLTHRSSFAIRHWLSAIRYPLSAIRHLPYYTITRHLPLALSFLFPLSLYLYLPLRGHIGSLDGAYQNTFTSFWRWVMASDYGNFITANPFDVHYDAAFFLNLFVNQFGWLGLMLSAFGVAAPFAIRHSPFAIRYSPFAVFLLVTFLTHLAFVLSYKVPDVQVFAIPAFMCMAIALGCGWDGVWRVARSSMDGGRGTGDGRRAADERPATSDQRRVTSDRRRVILFVILLWNFVSIFQTSFTQNDLSNKTDVRAHGRDMMAQPFPPNSTLIGILGEMTLVRYFQTTENLQPTLITIAADKDDERLQTIDRILRQAQNATPSAQNATPSAQNATPSAQNATPSAQNASYAVFTTRMLAGLSEKYALSAMGPLVRVWQAPPLSDLPANAPRVGNIKYRVENVTLAQPHRVRVNITWEPTMPIADDLKISARVLAGDRVVAAQDDWPVHNAYHTRTWRAGTTIDDVYDVRLPRDTPTQTYRVLLIVYRAENGAEVGRIEAGTVMVR
jgi:hypothetical protein